MGKLATNRKLSHATLAKYLTGKIPSAFLPGRPYCSKPYGYIVHGGIMAGRVLTTIVNALYTTRLKCAICVAMHE
eukprot:6195073-Pleurochrysis_carterae.AAC.2